MQPTGQTSTHAVSLVPIQGSAITYAIPTPLPRVSEAQIITKNASPSQIEKIGLYHQTRCRTSRFSSPRNYTTSGFTQPRAGPGPNLNRRAVLATIIRQPPGSAKNEVIPMLRTAGNRVTWPRPSTIQITTSLDNVILIDPYAQQTPS